MKFSEFNFETIFENCEFMRYESQKMDRAFRSMSCTMEEVIKDAAARERLADEIMQHCIAAQDSSFEQGFCFAVNIIKFMLKI